MRPGGQRVSVRIEDGDFRAGQVRSAMPLAGKDARAVEYRVGSSSDAFPTDYVCLEKLLLTMETNGVTCTTELARSIASHERRFVSMSLDGTDAEIPEWIRGLQGCFDGALEGAEL